MQDGNVYKERLPTIPIPSLRAEWWVMPLICRSPLASRTTTPTYRFPTAARPKCASTARWTILSSSAPFSPFSSSRISAVWGQRISIEAGNRNTPSAVLLLRRMCTLAMFRIAPFEPFDNVSALHSSSNRKQRRPIDYQIPDSSTVPNTSLTKFLPVHLLSRERLCQISTVQSVRRPSQPVPSTYAAILNFLSATSVLLRSHPCLSL